MLEHHFATPIYWYSPNAFERKLLLDEFKLKKSLIDNNLQTVEQYEYDKPRKTDQYHQSNAFETYQLEKTKEYIDTHIRRFNRLMKYKTIDAVCERAWLNKVDTGDSQIWHSHGITRVVGTLYYQVEAGDIEFKTPNPFTRAGMWPIDERYSPVISRTPKPGDLGLWPGWLEHRVTPNTSDVSRYSISFDYQ